MLTQQPKGHIQKQHNISTIKEHLKDSTLKALKR
jgi:predicted small metal-binding protein